LEVIRSKTYTSYGVDDVQKNEAHDQGYAAGVLTNGDKYFLHYDGSSIMSNGFPVHLDGTWDFIGGTGSLQRLRGNGRYEARPNAAGGMVFKIEGQYEVR
jgi:hypothetical protein